MQAQTTGCRDSQVRLPIRTSEDWHIQAPDNIHSNTNKKKKNVNSKKSRNNNNNKHDSDNHIMLRRRIIRSNTKSNNKH